jgi:hypothetical protein
MWGSMSSYVTSSPWLSDTFTVWMLWNSKEVRYFKPYHQH